MCVVLESKEANRMKTLRWMCVSCAVVLAGSMAFQAPLQVYATEGAEQMQEAEADSQEEDEEVTGEAFGEITIVEAEAETAEEPETGEDTVLGTGSFEELLATEDFGASDSEELFAGYVEQVMTDDVYGDDSMSKVYYAPRRSGLSETERALYDVFTGSAQAAAAGMLDSSWFVYDVGTILGKNTFTYAELGLNAGATQAQIEEAVCTMFGGRTLRKMVLSLLADLPYEMYWFDKTSGWYPKLPNYSFTKSTVTLSGTVGCGFSVNAAYAKNGQRGTRDIDRAKTGATKAAKANADNIVKRHANESDVQKLRSYRDEICALVSYNYDAVYSGVAYGDPWQMVNVFDGDPNTNVVCEGYAKAFQLLCDLTRFNSSYVECYTMTGTMSHAIVGSAYSGGHMWNVVRMDNGLNYIADVTNSDAGTTGDNYAFLKGDSAGGANGYMISEPGQAGLSYQYDNNTCALFSVAERTLSKGASYDADCAASRPEATATVQKASSDNGSTPAATPAPAANPAPAPAATPAPATTATTPEPVPVTVEPVVEQTGTWMQDQAGWWYLRADGSWPVMQWERIGGQWYYFDQNGYSMTGWVKSGAGWYYMDGSGVMVTGWVDDGGTWYYMGESGEMQTGWVKAGDLWYYMSGSGAMVTGWVDDGGTWYYMSGSGAMQTGWVSSGGAWYYMSESGAMQTGWIYTDGTWYYLDSSGAMLANTSRHIDGSAYTFDASGMCMNP